MTALSHWAFRRSEPLVTMMPCLADEGQQKPRGRVRPMNHPNLAAVHRVQAERLGPRPALRHRRHGLFRDLSWRQYRDDALACAAALADAGVRPGDRVGLLAENRVEWLVADLGILAAAAVNVPPHAPLTARQVQ